MIKASFFSLQYMELSIRIWYPLIFFLGINLKVDPDIDTVAKRAIRPIFKYMT